MASITLSGITKSFGGNRALRGLDLDIADGEFFVLLGRTGAGKTTTLRIIAGLEQPDSGTVAINGQDVGGRNAAERDVALVLQQYSLYPRLTVRGNLEFPLRSRIRKFSEDEIAARVEKAARTLQITPLLDRKVERLSGGEMQRVSIGRAIVREPQVFLMDEPLSALDAKLRESLRVELKALHADLGATFLYVTHDQVEAMSMGDKIGVLRNGQLVQVGTPTEVYTRPRNTFVARSVGTPQMNLMHATMGAGSARIDGQPVDLPVAVGEGEAGRALTLGIRPEDLVLEGGAPLEARVFDVEDHGVIKILTLDIGPARLHATVSAKTHVALDEVVRLGWRPDKVLLFDRATGENLAYG
ncbi:ABC transporter ATP-binding protein [Oceanomicrobium pacificus]|uniref:ATP-binding cassette domain-containing protein n=1 Tax=Oceanomicrobium pacificus TaxID=2692916 RepID=A0A6B0TSX6_9RHOB|nr:ABC transporter ATP-binding protein [Oceanomicrobium pacificus]MXU64322.1 ATP-binding cassette domain-containing protein [Oceanomicrobium pacificus]